MDAVHAEAVADGVRDATLSLMSGMGDYPITRSEIIDAIERGVKAAFIEVFSS